MDQTHSSPFSVAWRTQLMPQVLKMNAEAAQEHLREPPGCTKPSPDSTRWTSHTCKHRGILIRRLSYTPWFPHSHLLSSSGCLVLHQFSCKIATRTTQLSQNSIVSGLCSVLIPKWEHLGSQGRGSSPRASESGLGWFSSADGGPYLHDVLVYKKLCHQMTSERTEFWRTCQCCRFCDTDSIYLVNAIFFPEQ